MIHTAFTDSSDTHSGALRGAETRKTGRRYSQLLQGLYDVSVSGALLDFNIYWARTVSSEQENLLTSHTKHTFYELQYVLDGYIQMSIEGKQLRVNQSEMVVIPPNTFHEITDADDVGTRFIMAFSVSSDDARVAGALKAMEDLRPRAESPFIRRMLDFLFCADEPASDMRINRLLAESFLLELLAIFARSRQDIVTDPGIHRTKEQKYTAEILGYIHASCGIGISVSSLTKQFAVSERHLSRIFKAETGQTLKDAINHEKLKRIENLVATTSLSLNEISELCGFSDEYAMNKFFRRFNLINLSEYRKIATLKGRQGPHN